MADMWQVARKEFRGFFASPAAFLFLFVFLAVCLFAVFWVDGFFARNIADVRPLFHWMPLLMIFLVSALTMRSWSEEARSGTLEALMTSPVKPLALIFGKFFAVIGLVILALALTIFLPITVAFIGPLDWGPVIGGYVASVFLAAAYTAIGLYMSSRTDNAIVALILTVLVCGVFYLVGTPGLTNLFGYHVNEVLRGIGTGSRFDSITRGVLDLRDIYYYLSLVGVFLALNMLRLQHLRWAGNPARKNHRQWQMLTVLAIANLIFANIWLSQVNSARIDMTDGNIYSLSDASKHYLSQLQEPLLIRGYFSAKTHPLLEPLVPEVKDLLKEYAVASGNNVRVEFIDPQKDQEAEKEAASRYGIEPLSFQTANKYSAGVISSYFNIVVAYGDQYKVLSYEDLIGIKTRGDHLDVSLQNPEYAITGAIRSVMNKWQAGGSPFAAINGPVVFNGYMTAINAMPQELQELKHNLDEILANLKKDSDGKLQVKYQDPTADGGKLAVELHDKFGFAPQVMGLLNPQKFWFYMTLQSGDMQIPVPLPDQLDKASLKRSLTAALQRLAPGFTKTIALAVPKSDYMHRADNTYQALRQQLEQTLSVEDEDLSDGSVADNADFLLVMSPENLGDKEVFAIDQFLMRGGSVMIATSPYKLEIGQTLTAQPKQSGLKDWLASMGISMDSSLVYDPSNAALPLPVTRYVGGIPVREIRLLPYPLFPDLRDNGLSQDNPVTASLGQLTVNWSSPMKLDDAKTAGREVTPLLNSSADSWASSDLAVIPDYNRFPDNGFKPQDQHQSYLLGAAQKGRFTSYFEGKESPLAASNNSAESGKKAGKKADKKDKAQPEYVIEQSPESARLIVVSADSFASDTTLKLISEGINTHYSKPIDFIQNSIDWALEDPALLALRGRSQLARTLVTMPEGEQMTLEYLNYGLVIFGLFIIWLWRFWVRRVDAGRYRAILAEV